jgi:hypothetical protein
MARSEFLFKPRSTKKRSWKQQIGCDLQVQCFGSWLFFNLKPFLVTLKVYSLIPLLLHRKIGHFEESALRHVGIDIFRENCVGRTLLENVPLPRQGRAFLKMGKNIGISLKQPKYSDQGGGINVVEQTEGQTDRQLTITTN